jgi:hypothetical protein
MVAPVREEHRVDLSSSGLLGRRDEDGGIDEAVLVDTGKPARAGELAAVASGYLEREMQSSVLHKTSAWRAGVARQMTNSGVPEWKGGADRGRSVSGLVARVELEGTGPALLDLRSAPAARESL